MKFHFERMFEGFETYGEWYESTTATPQSLLLAGFFIRDFREWMLKWVFK